MFTNCVDFQNAAFLVAFTKATKCVHSVHTVYLCISCGKFKKLSPYMLLTGWSLQWRHGVFSVK